MDINNFIIEYWKNIASQNEMELKKFFHEDACIRWHNTNEQFNVSEFHILDYCNKSPIITYDGISVMFYPEQFEHELID